MILTGFVLAILMKALLFLGYQDHSPVYDISITILITVLVWEGNLRIDHWLNQRYPWVAHSKQRLILQFLLATLFSATTIFLMMFAFHSLICSQPDESMALMKVSFLVGLLVTFILLAIEICMQFFISWKASLIEVEKYRTESTQAQLKNLKDQINPHFLFNNLSVLSSLVYKDPDDAAAFIQELSRVYRYLLENKDAELCLVSDELNFLKSYTYLLQIRFGDNLHIQIQTRQDITALYLPPMCLQMLVENVIKHNETSKELPQEIEIIVEHDQVSVSNKLQLRIQQEPGMGTGLNNIRARYAFFTDKMVEISMNESRYTVRLPLIRKS